MSWKDMVATCREERVWSVVDGAQSIGQELNINQIIKTSIPTFVNYIPRAVDGTSAPTEGHPSTFVNQFILVAGTIDVVPYLSVTW
ncbi:hypothetical protein FOMPIDRAFT_93709 [Fomitopsis schrenkii]|uniref:Aminotransferase class V domain-containing protein n=1 Tax=Fomitopsis schrenkii TaxID=2126942 RepID=S8DLA0_FOMSC|nr:hypothetical protein FOMPIDRAFT_93709 [Fomitopsis schrenkii]